MFNEICRYESLPKAYTQARLGKRYQNKVCNFDFNLESNLIKLQKELISGNYVPLPYHHFIVTDPKKRNVAAPNFRDRVAQHSLVNLIEPIFEKKFIIDSYACRVEKGTSFGVKRVKKFLQAARCIYGKEKEIYVLQCDVEKFFKSIDWDILIKNIAKAVSCPNTMNMIEKIITTHQAKHDSKYIKILTPEIDQLHFNFQDQEKFSVDEVVSVTKRRGLPIGNLTSQLFANVYLNELDYFIKQTLKEKWYARYMDDFLIIHPDKEHLKQAKEKIREFLKSELKLRLHPRKLTIKNVKDGVTFLGYRIFYDHILIRGSTLIRMQRKYSKRKKQLKKGLITGTRFQSTKKSQEGHLMHADAWRLRKKMFGEN